jgi:hypothetical protein
MVDVPSQFSCQPFRAPAGPAPSPLGVQAGTTEFTDALQMPADLRFVAMQIVAGRGLRRPIRAISARREGARIRSERQQRWGRPKPKAA